MYDLIVIGGGMSGISVAHFFRGRNILVLERGQLLSGATGNNAGFVISGFGEHFNRTVACHGFERAVEIQKIHLANHARIRELAKAMECGARFDGSLSIAMSEKERQDLLQSSELMKDAGFGGRWIEKPAAGLKNSLGGFCNSQDGSIDSVLFWSQLARALPVETGCTVKTVENHPGGVEVVTSSGIFRGRAVVYCLNAFSAELVPQLAGRYIPLRGQMVELELDGPPPSLLPIYTEYGDIYWRFLERSLIFGGLEDRIPEEEVGIAADVSPRIRDLQLAWIREHFEPGPATGRVRRSWCSTMAFTVDGFPFVGRLPGENRYVLSGLCGLGHGYALECASWLYQLIAHDRDMIPAYFSSSRIENLPVYNGGNWRQLYEAWNH